MNDVRVSREKLEGLRDFLYALAEGADQTDDDFIHWGDELQQALAPEKAEQVGRWTEIDALLEIVANPLAHDMKVVDAAKERIRALATTNPEPVEQVGRDYTKQSADADLWKALCVTGQMAHQPRAFSGDAERIRREGGEAHSALLRVRDFLATTHPEAQAVAWLYTFQLPGESPEEAGHVLLRDRAESADAPFGVRGESFDPHAITREFPLGYLHPATDEAVRLLEWLYESGNSLKSEPSYDDPSDYHYIVVEHYLDEPKERVVGSGRNAFEALQDAFANQQKGNG